MILYKKILNELIKINFFFNFFQNLNKDFKILYYHGVKNDDEYNRISGPNKHLFVKKSEFIKQMDFLKNNRYNVISIDDLFKSKFKPRKKTIVITFDDGYKDNLEVVYPILKEKNFPFTIYIITTILKNDPWVWWIEAWNQIEKNNAISYDKKIMKLENDNQKKNFFFNLKDKLKKLKIDEQKKLLKEIFDIKTLSNMKSIFLDNKDINFLLTDDLITIGSHTDEHLSLKHFDENIVWKQIEKSKKFLETNFNFPVKHFSFPYGQREDINFKEDLILEKNDYLTGVTTLEYSYKKFNRFYLNRCSIGPYVDIIDFQRKILGIDSFFKKFFFR